VRASRIAHALVLAAVLAAGCSNSSSPTATSGPSRSPDQPAASAAAATFAESSAEATSAASTSAAATTTFATPDAAVTQYLAGVAQGDASRIVAACAIAEKSAGFSFGLYVDRLKAMMLYQSLAPAEYPFDVEINKALETSRILGQVKILTYSLLSTEQLDGSTIYQADKARADKFVTEVNPARLADLKVIAIRLSSPALQTSAKNVANMAAMSRVYGADEMAEWLALFSLGGKDYLVGFTLLRYGTNWKVSDQVANLAGTSSLGTAEPITVEEFDRLTSGG
jgi:hypothetical protein